MEPLGNAAIPFRHLGDLRENVAFPVASPERARLRSLRVSFIAARSSSESNLDSLVLVLRADFFLSLMTIPPTAWTVPLDGPHARDRPGGQASRFLIGLISFPAGWTQPRETCELIASRRSKAGPWTTARGPFSAAPGCGRGYPRDP